MSEDGRTMQERLETILREGRLLAQDAGKRLASLTRWAYRDVRRRLGWDLDTGEALEEGPPSSPKGAEPSAETGEPAGEVSPEAGKAGAPSSPEGYAVGQVWTPQDTSKKPRKVVDVKVENGEYYLLWQSPDGGKENRIKEDSFTRWVRRENAQIKS
ncbi:hypothetical protein [Thiohalorhabdus sp.]|uniref:hypothetical protein n=1 Tax=Thiohalorhabdus sp. TaxID=3094134 RepID=UPI002FC39BBD